jgi:large subunit ribosomal protein L29
MKAEKIRNLTDVELKHQERDLADQLFKLKFQMNMGQTESLKKIRGLRRDIARVQTVRREQELAAGKPAVVASSAAPAKASNTKASGTNGSKAKAGKTKVSKAKVSKAQLSKAEKR